MLHMLNPFSQLIYIQYNKNSPCYFRVFLTLKNINFLWQLFFIYIYLNN
jgi:hypothetical protein